MIVLKGRAYRGWLDHEGKGLKDSILALVEGLMEWEHSLLL